MSVPLEIKITFLDDFVLLSFGNPSPYETGTRSDWIRDQVYSQFSYLSVNEKNRLLMLSNTISTQEKAEKKLAQLKQDLHEEREERDKQFIRQQQPSQGVKRSRSEFESIPLLISQTIENPYDIIKSGVLLDNFITWGPKIQLPPFKDLTSIFVRDSYNDIYNLILQKLNTNLSQHHVVTGVPGIGKSTFSLYFLWRYLNDNPNAPVFCEFNYGIITLLNQEKSVTLSRSDCPLMDYPYLIDFSESSEPLNGLGSFQVVFCSPDESRYKNMMKNRNSSQYIMPVWTIEELNRLRPSFTTISDEIFNSRYDLVGGIPRHCFAPPEKDIQKMVETKISEKGFDLINQFMNRGFAFLEKDISHLLIHRHPDPMNGYCTENNNLNWATPNIFQMLFQVWRNTFRLSGANYFNHGPGPSGGAPAGLLFEKLCLHSDPINGPQNILKLPLAEASEKKTLTIPERRLYDSIEANLNPEVNVLYIPNQKNFESAEAFYLSETNELIVLQFTVGLHHPVKMNGLNKIFGLFTGKSISFCHFVFVVPLNGQLNSIQAMHTTDSNVAKVKTPQVQQFESNQWRLEYHLQLSKTS